MKVSLNKVAILQHEAILANVKGAIAAIILDIIIIILILYNPSHKLMRVVQFADSLVDKPGRQIDYGGGSKEIDTLIQALNNSSAKLKAQKRLIHKKTKMLERLASLDSLTQIPNRSIFVDRLEHSIKNAKRTKTELLVIFIDLNDFKPVNDGFGHQVGDKLLQQFALRLQSCIRESDSLARYGGDEFIILLTNVSNELQVSEIVDNLRRSVTRDYNIAGKKITISVSIGLASYPSDGLNSADLLNFSDQNMYKEKRQHKNIRSA